MSSRVVNGSDQVILASLVGGSRDGTSQVVKRIDGEIQSELIADGQRYLYDAWVGAFIYTGTIRPQ